MIKLNVVKNRKVWLSLSAVLMTASIVVLALFGLKFGIDFTGGSLMEVKFHENAPTNIEIRDNLSDLSLSSLSVQPTENDSFILRFSETSADTHSAVLASLSDLANEINADFEELRFDSVGPSIGQELKNQSVNTAILVLVLIILYVALVFRKISKPVASWTYGVSAIVALFHDVLIVLGVFAILGHFYGVEVNTPFIAAILTVLGYSVNDSIVVFDRIRETLPKSEDNFVDTIDKSISAVLTRSINTSATTLLVLLSIVFFGGETIRDFVLALAIGIFVGTYSSIFISSPLLVLFDRKKS